MWAAILGAVSIVGIVVAVTALLRLPDRGRGDASADALRATPEVAEPDVPSPTPEVTVRSEEPSPTPRVTSSPEEPASASSAATPPVLPAAEVARVPDDAPSSTARVPDDAPSSTARSPTTRPRRRALRTRPAHGTSREPARAGLPPRRAPANDDKARFGF